MGGYYSKLHNFLIMKILLTFLLALATTTLVAQTTVINNAQIRGAAGAPSGATPGTNWGFEYADNTGLLHKGSLQALIGSRIRSISALNDSTLTIGTDSASFNLKIRGLLGVLYKQYIDSLRAGQVLDSNSVIFVGTSGTRLGWVSVTKDSFMVKNIVDSTVGCTTYPDSTIHCAVKPSGVTPGTYGDATHTTQLIIGGDGRIALATPVTITGSGTGGGTVKKSINTQTGTTYQLTGLDTATYIKTTNSSPITITVPDDATTAMSAPVSLDIFQFGAGKISILPLNGNISVQTRKGVARSAGQYSKVNLFKLSANLWQLSGDLDTATIPILAYSGTLSPFQTTQGSVSPVQSFSFTGTSLTGPVTWTSPSDLQISGDSSTWTSSVAFTPSSGLVSSKLYVRTSASTGVGNYAGNIQGNSSGATPVNNPYVDTVTAATVAQFTFSANPQSVTGWTNVYGDPTLSPSFRDATTGWLIQMMPSGSNWGKLSGQYYGGNGNGATGASTDGAFSAASIQSNLYTYSWTFSTTGYNIQVQVSQPGIYSVEILGSIPTSTYPTGGPAAFHVQFSNGSDNISTFTPNNNLTASGPGTVNVQTGSFNGTVVTGALYINIGVCVSGGGQLGLINGLIIKKIG